MKASAFRGVSRIALNKMHADLSVRKCLLVHHLGREIVNIKVTKCPHNSSPPQKEMNRNLIPNTPPKKN